MAKAKLAPVGPLSPQKCRCDRPSFMCGDYPYPPQPNTTNKHGQARKNAGVCEHGCDCKGAPLLCESED